MMMHTVVTPSLFLFFVIVTVIAGFTVHQQESPKAGDQRYLKAYTGPFQTGAFYQYLDYESDLSEQGMDDIIMSSCTTGYWIIYEDTNYIGTSCHLQTIDHCGNWTTCVGTASSLRYAGSPFGLNDNYFNLYESLNFQGDEFRGNADVDFLGDMDAAASSLIIIGQSGWTFYSDIQQTGSAVCVYPSQHIVGEDGTFMDYGNYCRLSEIGLPDNSIRSVARGCLSDRVVRAPLPNGTTVHSLQIFP